MKYRYIDIFPLIVFISSCMKPQKMLEIQKQSLDNRLKRDATEYNECVKMYTSGG